jgi:hypothetical protein
VATFPATAIAGTGQLGGPAYGITPANFPHWRLAVARAQANAQASKVLMLGTSITRSESGSGAVVQGTQNPAAYLAQFLNARFATAQQSFSGVSNAGDFTGDARWAAGTGWTFMSAGAGFGWANQGYIAAGVGAAGSLVYTPGAGTGSVDTFDIYYISSNITGTAQWHIDANADVALNTTAGAPGTIAKSTLTTTAGTSHTLTVHTITVNPVYIVGVDAYLSTQLGLRVGNVGLGTNGTSSNWTGGGINTTLNALACIQAWAPSLTLIELGADDSILGSPPTTSQFLSNVSTIVASVVAGGSDVLFWTQPLSSTSAFGAAVTSLQQQYAGALVAYAQQNNFGVVDIATRFGPFSPGWGSQGFSQIDGIHPLPVGNSDIANALETALALVA